MARELGNMRITYIVFRSKHNFYFVLLSLEDVYVFGWKNFVLFLVNFWQIW